MKEEIQNSESMTKILEFIIVNWQPSKEDLIKLISESK